jgi:hypothetical protein
MILQKCLRILLHEMLIYNILYDLCFIGEWNCENYREPNNFKKRKIHLDFGFEKIVSIHITPGFFLQKKQLFRFFLLLLYT